jgi:hypothetical protein
MTREGVDAARRGDQRDGGSLKDSDFPKQGPPATGRRHLGLGAQLEVQSRAEPRFAFAAEIGGDGPARRLPSRPTEDQSVCADLDTLPLSRSSLGQTQVQNAAADPRLDAGRINRS